jgi:predicted RNase H-like HicB family nuclease
MGREPDGRTTSVELCGGTHCLRTGDIALFKITSESAVAAGIRRIDALTGEAAYRLVRDEERLLGEAAATLKVPTQELPERLTGLVAERRRLEQEISRLRQQLATGGGPAGDEAKEVAGIRFAARQVEGVPARDLRGLADAMQRQIGRGVAAVVSWSTARPQRPRPPGACIAFAAASCHLQGRSEVRQGRGSLMASDVADPAASKDSALTITVVVRRLPEGVWLATSDDLPGLIVETETREEAIDLSPELALELLNENGERSDRARP